MYQVRTLHRTFMDQTSTFLHSLIVFSLLIFMFLVLDEETGFQTIVSFNYPKPKASVKSEFYGRLTDLQSVLHNLAGVETYFLKLSEEPEWRNNDIQNQDLWNFQISELKKFRIFLHKFFYNFEKNQIFFSKCRQKFQKSYIFCTWFRQFSSSESFKNQVSTPAMLCKTDCITNNLLFF